MIAVPVPLGDPVRMVRDDVARILPVDCIPARIPG